MVRKLVCEVLAEQGYRVCPARDGQEAWARAPSEFDFVLIDVVMPRVSGGELARIMAREPPDLPVLFKSGHPDARATLTTSW
ncbi:MAG TPA: response regulator [Candidatus Eisenbacteria bacterium]|nr:response regulator [Candidatus Eisenbacteria bacterium]